MSMIVGGMMINKKLKEFKKELTEEFYKTKKYRTMTIEFFKNPTTKEIKKEDLAFRGILMKNGDLIIPNNRLIHSQILGMLNLPHRGPMDAWYLTPKSLEDYLCVFTDDFKTFYIAESYFAEMIKDYKHLFNKYIKIMKKNNSSRTLIIKKVFD